jgi:hypothetical protein
MGAIKFEHIAPYESSVNIPLGYAGMNWSNFGAMGRGQAEGTLPITNGYLNAMDRDGVGFIADFGSGTVVGQIAASDGVSKVSLKGGTFAAAWNNNEKLTVRAWIGSDVVGEKSFKIGQTPVTVDFNGNFRHVDYITFVSKGGTDATPDDFASGGFVAVENLQIAVDGARHMNDAPSTHEAHLHRGVWHDHWQDLWPDVPFL